MAVTGHARRIALHEGRGETELGRVELDGGANVAHRQARVVLLAFDGGDLPCWFGVFHRGSRSTLSPILKIDVLAPMPSASVSTATAVKPGFLSNWRKANLRSFIAGCQSSLSVVRCFSFRTPKSEFRIQITRISAPRSDRLWPRAALAASRLSERYSRKTLMPKQK